MKIFMLLPLLFIALSVFNIGEETKQNDKASNQTTNSVSSPYSKTDSHDHWQDISLLSYEDKVLGSWYGHIIGNIYGLRHENVYVDEPGPDNFPYGYGSMLTKLTEVNGAFSDDDTDIEYMYLLEMEKHGIEPSYAQLAQAWKYHIRDKVWLANRSALALMHHNYQPPTTGLKQYNPHWFQIDPQLINEIWAITAPGMIDYATQKSEWAARISNDGEGLEPTIHYSAMFAAAFFESDILKLIRIGQQALPANSLFSTTIDDITSAGTATWTKFGANGDSLEFA